jgi:small subunit ribosomal protein S17
MLRKKRKIAEGKVISARMQKTAVVQVERLARHPKYKRVIRSHSKFKVHDAKGEARVGDWVRIMETRPISKEKNWRIVEILKDKI